MRSACRESHSQKQQPVLLATASPGERSANCHNQQSTAVGATPGEPRVIWEAEQSELGMALGTDMLSPSPFSKAPHKVASASVPAQLLGTHRPGSTFCAGCV